MLLSCSRVLVRCARNSLHPESIGQSKPIGLLLFNVTCKYQVTGKTMLRRFWDSSDI